MSSQFRPESFVTSDRACHLAGPPLPQPKARTLKPKISVLSSSERLTIYTNLAPSAPCAAFLGECPSHVSWHLRAHGTGDPMTLWHHNRATRSCVDENVYLLHCGRPHLNPPALEGLSQSRSADSVNLTWFLIVRHLKTLGLLGNRFQNARVTDSKVWGCFFH